MPYVVRAKDAFSFTNISLATSAIAIRGDRGSFAGVGSEMTDGARGEDLL